jgi:tetratricopeptide (TPR) repeat protein
VNSCARYGDGVTSGAEVSQSDFVSRGQALVSAGQYQEAVKVCRLGLLGRPTTVEGRVVLGQALLALKRFDEVLAEMRVALELDHASVPAQLLKCEALLRKGDPHGALDVLQRARLQMPNDAYVQRLLAEAQHALGKPTITASHPAVGFVGKGDRPSEDQTRHYPHQSADEEDTSDDDGHPTEGYTRPTSLSAPGAKRMTPDPASSPDVTPSPAILAIGDRSGTVEVDPELEGIELENDEELGELAPPPRSGLLASQRAPARGPARPSRVPRAPLPGPGPARGIGKAKADISTLELDDDEIIEVDVPARFRPVGASPGPGTRARNTV